VIFTKKDIFWGGSLLAISDTIAAYLTNEFSVSRLLGMLFIGATLYAIEIPNYFDWLEKFVNKRYKGIKKSIVKTIASNLFFNPLWIFRHFVFIYLFLGRMDMINTELLNAALMSYIFNIPISIIGNYIIQNKISLEWRFVSNSIFMAILTLYYALSPSIFG